MGKKNGFVGWLVGSGIKNAAKRAHAHASMAGKHMIKTTPTKIDEIKVAGKRKVRKATSMYGGKFTF